jgi:hypothetical protein
MFFGTKLYSRQFWRRKEGGREGSKKKEKKNIRMAQLMSKLLITIAPIFLANVEKISRTR